MEPHGGVVRGDAGLAGCFLKARSREVDPPNELGVLRLEGPDQIVDAATDRRLERLVLLASVEEDLLTVALEHARLDDLPAPAIDQRVPEQPVEPGDRALLLLDAP